MMVYGGWEMSADDGSSKKRADAQPSKFLNLTSMEWATSSKTPAGFERRTRPPGTSKNPDAPDVDKSSSDKARSWGWTRLGLAWASWPSSAPSRVLLPAQQAPARQGGRDSASKP